jgi:hypothetical protein
MLPGIEESFGKNDIVYIPLYRGNASFLTGYTPEADCTHQKLDCYVNNLNFIHEFGKDLGMILVGNIGPEISFKHLFLYGGETRKAVLRRQLDFVMETGELILDAGARPCFPIIDWDLAADCYFGNWECRNLINSLGGTALCFPGFHLFGIGQTIPERNDRCWDFCPMVEDPPFPIISEYIRGFDHSITGLDYAEGLRKGNDITLLDHGFGAGLFGWYPS